MSDHNLHPATEPKAQSSHYGTAVQCAVAAAQHHQPTYWRPDEPFHPHFWVLDAIIAGIERASESHPFDAITAEGDRSDSLTDAIARQLSRTAAIYDIRAVGRFSNGMQALFHAYRMGEAQAMERANPFWRIREDALHPTDTQSEQIIRICDAHDIAPPKTNTTLSSMLVQAMIAGYDMAAYGGLTDGGVPDLIDDTLAETPFRAPLTSINPVDAAIETTVRLMTATHEDSTAQAALNTHLGELLAYRRGLITNPVWVGIDMGSPDGDKTAHGMGILDMPAYKAEQQERNERASRALDEQTTRNLAASRQWLVRNLGNAEPEAISDEELRASITRSQSGEAWIVVKEHVVKHSGWDPRDELAYLWPADGHVYSSFEAASNFIKGQSLELGWVAKQIIKGDGAPTIDFSVIDKAANHQLGQQIHVGKAAINGKPLWHSNGRGRFWTGIHNDRTAQQLWDECHSVLAGLRGLAAGARIVESATVTDTRDGATARIDLTGGK